MFICVCLFVRLLKGVRFRLFVCFKISFLQCSSFSFVCFKISVVFFSSLLLKAVFIFVCLFKISISSVVGWFGLIVKSIHCGLIQFVKSSNHSSVGFVSSSVSIFKSQGSLICWNRQLKFLVL